MPFIPTASRSLHRLPHISRESEKPVPVSEDQLELVCKLQHAGQFCCAGPNGVNLTCFERYTLFFRGMIRSMQTF
ncbi:hypothetical protein FKM82_012306 [Ascaphus truei]